MRWNTMPARVLFICGTLNQTASLHAVARLLDDHDCWFSPFYADGLERVAARLGLLNFSVLGGRHMQDTRDYLKVHGLQVDERGSRNAYDLVVTGSDLIVQKNVRRWPLVLVQDGITEPETAWYWAVKHLHVPRYFANTAALGLSHAYEYFCVASAGYGELFVGKGVRAQSIVVTGLPHLASLADAAVNEFPLHGYVLVATSPLRESFRRDDRVAFLKKCRRLAAGRPVIVKLHPTENVQRATREIERWLPGALVLTRGNVNAMIANACAVITQQSTCTFAAVALGKEVHTDLNLEELRRLMPIQNGPESASRIADVCRHALEATRAVPKENTRPLRRLVISLRSLAGTTSFSIR
jgi:hypothetical protein